MSQDVVADLEIILTGNTAPYIGAMERAAAAGDAAATSAERAGRATAAAGTESAAAGARAASGAAAAESGSGRWVKAAERSKTAFKGLGLAAAAIFVGSVYSAVEFEKQMELVHTQAGASQSEVEKLKGAVLAMAPAAGIGPTKLAEALFHVESVGYRGADAMKVLKSAADGAKVGNADLDSTTYALTPSSEVCDQGPVRCCCSVRGRLVLLHAQRHHLGLREARQRLGDCPVPVGYGVLVAQRRRGGGMP